MPRHYTLHRSPAAGPGIDFAAELNPQQYAAVTAPPGPALVIAGAGSGKTRTLTYRVAYLLGNGVQPQHILLLTFTNKAAREMLDRVSGLCPQDLAGLWGGTFHSIGNRILRRHPKEAGFAPGFSIMDREDSEDMLDDVVAGLGMDPKEKRTPKGEVIADALSYQLNTGKPLDEVLVEKYPHFLEFASYFRAAREKYELKKQRANALDFDDLLEKTVKMLKAHPAIAEHYQRQFQFVLVDEYQDTNHLQNDFIEILAQRHHNVMVVGDDAQSIYSWRGADFRNILEFPKRHSGAKVFKIEMNYRSVPEVLEVANAAIAGNANQFRKELKAARPSVALKPAYVPVPDSQQQAQFVAQRMLELHEEGMKLEEMAVLYRAHFHSMELQMELTRRGIPFEVTSGLRFFEQAHVKDVGAFLKWVVNPKDEVAFKRMARLLPGIGAKSADSLWGQVSEALNRGLRTVVETQVPNGPVRAVGSSGEATGQVALGAGERTEDGHRGEGSMEAETQVDGTEDRDAPVEALPESVANPWEGLPPIKELLLPLKVPAKSAKAWVQLVLTLDEMAPGGKLIGPSEMIRTVLEAVYNDYLIAKFPNYQQRREDLDTLANFARQYEKAQEFLDQLALLTGLDTEEVSRAEESDRVTLTSVHQAKGLEWKVVFVIWLADGKFPSSRSMESTDTVEEERRLFYVAVTRAMDELYLTYPCVSYAQGYGDPLQRPSRFLMEIPRELMEEWEIGGGIF